MNRYSSLLLIFFGLVVSMTSVSEDYQLANLEAEIRKRYPDYQFNKIVQDEVFREGKSYKSYPYVLEKFYSTSSRVCRTRKIPAMFFLEKSEEWEIDDKNLNEYIIYMALVVNSNDKCGNLSFDNEFIFLDNPITDDSIIKLYDSFEDTDEIKRQFSEVVPDDWEHHVNGFHKALEAGRIVSMGINQYHFDVRNIDYKVMLGSLESSVNYLFYVYYDGPKIKIREVELVFMD